MCNAMAIAREKLPGDTKMFPGHEYAIANLNFCKIADPENSAVLAMSEKVQKQRAEGLWAIPTTLDEEKTFNVFMRVFDEDIQKLTGQKNPVDTMRFLREWKNNGNKPNL